MWQVRVADKIRDRSRGQITTEWFWRSSLLSPTEALQAMGKGDTAVQMATPNPNELASVAPAAQALVLPYLFSEKDTRDASVVNKLTAASTPLGAVLRSQAEQHNVLFIGGFILPSPWLFSRKVVRTPNDLRGFKLRVKGNSQLDLAIARSLGYTPTLIPANEIGTALRQGVIDGVAASFDFDLTMPDAASYLIDIGALYPQTRTIVANKTWWESVPATYEQVIATAWTEQSTLDDHQATDDDEQTTGLKKLQAAGKTVISWGPAAVDEARRLTKQAYMVARDVLGAQIYDYVVNR
jgi:TRAP-type C4-dicarboxylate transport system substrate-binding protein